MSRTDEDDREPRPHGNPPTTVDEDVDRELRAHVEMRVEELVRDGLTPEEARREAARSFGDLPRISTECKEITATMTRHRSWHQMIETLVQDTGYALRSLAKAPGFAAVAVATLALGIGANSAIFSIVDGVLLEPLPYPDPQELVVVWERNESGSDAHVAWANFADWREATTTLSGLATHPSYAFGGPTTVLGADEPLRALVGGVSRDFFGVFGIDAAAGRLLTAADHRPGAAPVVVVSHDFWRDHLGAPRDLAGRTLRFYGSTAEIVGVAQPGFDYPSGTQIWFPVELFNPSRNSSRTSHNYAVIGRIAEGATIDQARQELEGITRALKAEYGDGMDAVGVSLRSLEEELVGDLERPLYNLLGAAALVLLVACTNIASMLLARGSRRAPEVAVRASLGAPRGRLVRQFLTESSILALLGAAVGLIAGRLVVTALLATGADTLPTTADVGLDASVLGFTALVALGTVVIFGLAPAVRTSWASVATILRSDARDSSSDRDELAWKALVGGEVALTLILLIGAGLLIRSFAGILAIDPGFDPNGVLTAEVSVPSAEYPSNAQVAEVHRRLLDRLRTLPGVEAAGLVNDLPLGGAAINGFFEIEGRGPSDGSAHYRVASPGYFEAMRIPLIRGRAFEETDDVETPGVAVINQRMAERFWPDENPVGQRVRNLANDSFVYPGTWLTIVGVVGDVRHRALTEGAVPEIYVHVQQRPFRARSAVIALRVEDDPLALAPAVRSAIRAVDGQIPLEVSTAASVVAASTAGRRFVLGILGVFAAIALALSAVGIYGVVSYSVTRRTREMGIRIALGAAPRTVRHLVLKSSMGTVLVGIAIGTAGALAATTLLEGMLWEVSATDPLTFAGVVTVLLATAFVASLIPARRGSRTDPMVAMQAD